MQSLFLKMFVAVLIFGFSLSANAGEPQFLDAKALPIFLGEDFIADHPDGVIRGSYYSHSEEYYANMARPGKRTPLYLALTAEAGRLHVTKDLLRAASGSEADAKSGRYIIFDTGLDAARTTIRKQVGRCQWMGSGAKKRGYSSILYSELNRSEVGETVDFYILTVESASGQESDLYEKICNLSLMGDLFKYPKVASVMPEAKPFLRVSAEAKR